ncbi:hypothetical protein J3458_002905 [Metarhizium acridum]|uniref:uncharacterized protein n=1 Tax=Metarhizium acridum TaxID=92637 RepID=UPI001C6B9244|nr:hypothetical protein J3458_002905 [Metarhizium acridum]
MTEDGRAFKRRPISILTLNEQRTVILTLQIFSIVHIRGSKPASCLFSTLSLHLPVISRDYDYWLMYCHFSHQSHSEFCWLGVVFDLDMSPCFRFFFSHYRIHVLFLGLLSPFPKFFFSYLPFTSVYYLQRSLRH